VPPLIARALAQEGMGIATRVPVCATCAMSAPYHNNHTVIVSYHCPNHDCIYNYIHLRQYLHKLLSGSFVFWLKSNLGSNSHSTLSQLTGGEWLMITIMCYVVSFARISNTRSRDPLASDATITNLRATTPRRNKWKDRPRAGYVYTEERTRPNGASVV
jgi:hypothetical protein